MRVEFVVTEEDGIDAGQTQILTIDDHSSATNGWAVQWVDIVHRNLTQRHYKCYRLEVVNTVEYSCKTGRINAHLKA